MEPLHFVAKQGESGIVIEDRDAQTLFRRAGSAFEEGRHTDAIRDYELLLADFPGSHYKAAGRYNLGLTYEKAGRHGDAVQVYRAIIAETPEGKDALDASFRIATCYESLHDWERAAEAFAAVLRRGDLSDGDRIEASVRHGMSLLELGRLDAAEMALRAVLRPARGRGPRPLLPTNHLLAQAQFGMARIEHARFTTTPIRLPQHLMEQDIQEKARTFLRAQAAYLRAMGFRDRYWSSAAGLRIGLLYEDFYDDLMEAPVPAELNEEEVTVYFEELRKTIRPLVERAIYVYERNIRLAEGLGDGNQVLVETQERLDRLHEFIGEAKPDEQPPPGEPASEATEPAASPATPSAFEPPGTPAAPTPPGSTQGAPAANEPGSE
jgi:tetratricopeptide (TPR) repeat protein